MSMSLRDLALKVLRVLRQHGHQALWAGGCVRDQLLGLPPHDYDVATDARPDVVRQLFPRTLAVGAQFGVIEVLGPGKNHVQVATFRSDGTYSDGRHPDQVRFGTPEADAQRRDFTINGLFFDPLAEEVIDYVGGQADLASRILRAIGDPWARFQEDHLRLLRAVRFTARFDLALDLTTKAALEALAPQILTVSPERIADELRKMLMSPARTRAVRLLLHLGLLPHLLGDVAVGVDEKAALATLQALPEATSFAVALAALLVDTTSAATQETLREVGRGSPLHGFAQHLRLSNLERDQLEWLLGHLPDFAAAPHWPASRLKPLLAHPWAEELLVLSAAWEAARGRPPAAAPYARTMQAVWGTAVDPPPLVTGEDLKALGLEPGPRFKKLLEAVRTEQLDGRLDSPTAALAWIKAQLEADG